MSYFFLLTTFSTNAQNMTFDFHKISMQLGAESLLETSTTQKIAMRLGKRKNDWECWTLPAVNNDYYFVQWKEKDHFTDFKY